MTDRYLYMPSLGFCLILSYLLIKLLKDKTTIITTFSIILIFYSFFTIKQNKIWQDEMTLWGNVIKKFSGPAHAYYDRGNIYYDKGLYDEAIKDYNKAIQLNPKYAVAYNNRGIAYYKKGLKDLAIKDLKKSADLGYEPARKILKEYFNIEY